jgi:hypothetical protein
MNTRSRVPEIIGRPSLIDAKALFELPH